jgi:hypothetical protein
MTHVDELSPFPPSLLPFSPFSLFSPSSPSLSPVVVGVGALAVDEVPVGAVIEVDVDVGSEA